MRSNLISCVLFVCLVSVDSEKIKFIDHRASVEEVKEYLLSIGFTLQEVCQNESSSDRILESLEMEDEKSPFFFLNYIMALCCVLVAALAAGLTMGLVSQELLDLRIKEVAGDQEEKNQARSLIPLLQDHHRLLVTLLLINAMANEALPLFLDKIVPAYMAVILSVTLVLFFGEIIPSAIFSGPNKLAVSSRLAPVVKILLLILYPLAWPIGKLLDKVLHEDDDEGFMQKYNRKELSALVRLQYEERQASKLRMKRERANVGIGASNRYIRHIDTVNMIDGALDMHVKLVADIMVPIKKVFAIPSNTCLNEHSFLDIYRNGFSRIPVYQGEADDKRQIIGILRTRQLMVLNPHEDRPLTTLPLTIPYCVEPSMNLITLVNLLQTGMTRGKGGHMAIVCHNPNEATVALDGGEAIPPSAGVLGIATLENCLEVLLKEDIIDESDLAEVMAIQRARSAYDHWRTFVKKKQLRRENKEDNPDANETKSLVVKEDSPLLGNQIV